MFRNLGEDDFYLAVLLELDGLSTNYLSEVQDKITISLQSHRKYQPGSMSSSAGQGKLGSSLLDDNESEGPIAGGAATHDKTSVLYKQLDYSSAMISNWKIVLDDLKDPDIMTAVHNLFCTFAFDSDNYATMFQELNEHFSGHEKEETWRRVSLMVHDSDRSFDLVSMYIEKIFSLPDLSIEQKEALAFQAYRKTFLYRIQFLFQRFYSLKSKYPDNSAVFSTNQPFREINIPDGEYLFIDNEAVQAERPWNERQEEFMQNLEAKLGVYIQSRPPAVKQKSPEEIEARLGEITRKYYRSPGTGLEFKREECLKKFISSENDYTDEDLMHKTSWGELRDLATMGDVAGLKKAHDKR